MENNQTATDYRTAAKNLFSKSIQPNFPSYMGNEGENIWRTTWALDTLIDYFSIVDSSPVASFIKSVFDNKLLDATKGFWWDDYGWTGIACLRAALSFNLDGATQSFLIQNAINCWCYMHGPGWQIGGGP